ncbi:MAG: TonB family protein [Gemmatimonadota bacterium]
MLFRRLVQSNARGTLITTLEGYAVSVLTHVAIFAATIVATNQSPSTSIADSFESVAYFTPRDRILGSKPKQERINFVSTEAAVGNGEAALDDKALVRVRQDVEPGPGMTEMSSELSNDEPQTAETAGDSVMSVLEVDSAAARYDDSAAPPYPPAMLAKRIEGSVGIQYVVDTTGHADTTSIVVLSRTHEDFARSVTNTLPLMQFRPAIMNGRKVRQLVQQMFAFRIDTMIYAQQLQQNKKPDKQ